MICASTVRFGVNVRKALVRVTGPPDLPTARAVTVYLCETFNAQRLCQTVRAALKLPATAAPPLRAITFVSLPPAAVTVIPLSGAVSVLRSAGVIDSRTLGFAGAAGLCPPPPPPQPAAVSPRAAQIAINAPEIVTRGNSNLRLRTTRLRLHHVPIAAPSTSRIVQGGSRRNGRLLGVAGAVLGALTLGAAAACADGDPAAAAFIVRRRR